MLFNSADRQNLLAATPGNSSGYYDVSPISAAIKLPAGLATDLILAYLFDPGATTTTLSFVGGAQVNGEQLPFQQLSATFVTGTGLQVVGTSLDLPQQGSIYIERVVASILNQSAGVAPASLPVVVALFRNPVSFVVNQATTTTPATAGPTVTAVNPAIVNRRTATTITVTGTNFDNTASVTAQGTSGQGTISLSNVTVTNNSTLSGIFYNPSLGGTYDIVVQTSSGVSAKVLADQFTSS